MLELYAANTPNGQRAAVVLEECGLAPIVHKIDVHEPGWLTPELQAIVSHDRVPVILDHDVAGERPLKVAQSWLICVYAAEKTGLFLPVDRRQRLTVMEWFMLVATDLAGPSSSLTAVGRSTAGNGDLSALFRGRVIRTLANIEGQLAQTPFVAGDISIADFALYPIVVYRAALLAADDSFPNIKRWGQTMDMRPGCRRGMDALR